MPLNVQPDGTAALWFALSAMPPEGATVVLDGHNLNTANGTNLVTATVDDKLVRYPGDKLIYVERRLLNRNERSNVVKLHISP